MGRQPWVDDEVRAIFSRVSKAEWAEVCVDLLQQMAHETATGAELAKFIRDRLEIVRLARRSELAQRGYIYDCGNCHGGTFARTPLDKRCPNCGSLRGVYAVAGPFPVAEMREQATLDRLAGALAPITQEELQEANAPDQSEQRPDTRTAAQREYNALGRHRLS